MELFVAAFSVHFFRYRISLPTLVELLRTVPLLGPFAQARYPGLWKEQMCAKRHGHFVDEFGHYPSGKGRSICPPQEWKGSFENPLSFFPDVLVQKLVNETSNLIAFFRERRFFNQD